MTTRRELLGATACSVLGSGSIIALTKAMATASAMPKQGSVIDVREFGAGSTVATSHLQAALNYAGSVAPARVVATDRQYRTDELVVPPGVTFEFNLKMHTPAAPKEERNCLRPHSNCRLIGKIEGNGLAKVEVVERGIFPAVEGCHDVQLDVEITGATVAVAALLYDLRNPPRRWSGRIIARDIAGHPGGSNGYGLNGTLCDSNLEIISENVPRHALYLAAGASNNRIVLHDDGSSFAPLDIAALEGQPPCRGNVVVAYVRNHRANYPKLNCVGGLLAGNCIGNTIELHVSASRPLYAAFRTVALTAKAYPKDNRVTVFFTGEVTGPGVVDLSSGSNTEITVMGSGASTGSPSSVVYVGRNDRITPEQAGSSAVKINAVDFRCDRGFEHAVIVAQDYATADLGNGVVNVRGYTLAAVNHFNFGEVVTGWVR